MSRFIAASLLCLVACGAREAHGPRIPVADPGAATDAINTGDLPKLRRHAKRVLAELVAALPEDERARVTTLELISDNALGDVNAYASCDDQGTPIIAISDGLLLIHANLASSTAIDEMFETTKADSYLDWMSLHGITPPPSGFYPTAYHEDRIKLLRQREVFEEQVAFVLGHELAHHYLGHLACNSDGGVVEEAGQLAADTVPIFSQTGELAADIAGTKNLLEAGSLRNGYAWTEDGALLVISAFHRHHETGLSDVVFAFARSHPLPHLRIPIITKTAEVWASSGGLLPL